MSQIKQQSQKLAHMKKQEFHTNMNYDANICMAAVQQGDILAQSRNFPNSPFWLSYYLLKNIPNQLYILLMLYMTTKFVTYQRLFSIYLNSCMFRTIIFAVVLHSIQMYQFIQRSGVCALGSSKLILGIILERRRILCQVKLLGKYLESNYVCISFPNFIIHVGP